MALKEDGHATLVLKYRAACIQKYLIGRLTLSIDHAGTAQSCDLKDLDHHFYSQFRAIFSPRAHFTVLRDSTNSIP